MPKSDTKVSTHSGANDGSLIDVGHRTDSNGETQLVRFFLGSGGQRHPSEVVPSVDLAQRGEPTRASSPLSEYCAGRIDSVVPATLDHLKESLADRYHIERPIGRGGMAIVYLAREIDGKASATSR